MLIVADAKPGSLEPVRCPHFGPCGGCTMLEQPYDAECGQKERNFERWVRAQKPLRDALREAELLPLVRAEEPLFYRTSLKVPLGARVARGGGAAKVVAGFYRPGTHRIVDLNVCAIQHPSLVRLLIGVRHAVQELGVAVDQAGRPGVLRYLVARTGLGTGQVLAGLVVRRACDPSVAKLAEVLFARFRATGLVGVVENVNASSAPRVLGRATRPLCGATTLASLEDGLSIETSLATFAQANAGAAQILYREVVAWLEPLHGKRVVDLYCGYGPIALRLARAGADVVAVERNAQAVEDGRRTAERNGLFGRISFSASDAAHFAGVLASAPPDAVVVDPPRRGLSEQTVARLLETPAERVVYVSCSPKTFVRDLALFAQRYAIRRLRAVDMFPRTRHLEALALLERRK